MTWYLARGGLDGAGECLNRPVRSAIEGSLVGLYSSDAPLGPVAQEEGGYDEIGVEVCGTLTAPITGSVLVIEFVMSEPSIYLIDVDMRSSSGGRRADRNSCVDGQVCGHYTWVVWQDSTTIGCAPTHCDNGDIFIIYNYNPTTNIEGQSPY
ncbi:hypothetical protein B296_00032336 [Ensete ventricosum]|uniref:SCP domain-containing protein n=1 Tax=Ensete ventricosum TaxID=4639 RepID=A0A426Y924_ENSVE|nr:hypothetical protein B296_00032336 [Ensete ventricosum]